MPSFAYRAYDAKGAAVSGALTAESREAALEALARRGVYPAEIEVGDRAIAPEIPWWERDVGSWSRGGLPDGDLAVLTRELATLFKAELPADEVLRIVALQPSVNARTRTVVAGVLARVMEGKSLSEAFALARPAFPELYWRTVSAGESGGNLAAVLDDLARYLERGNEARARLASALIYPAILIAAAAAALAVIMTVLLPTIAPLFKEAGKEPPAVLAFLIGAQAWLAAHWPWVVSALVAGILFLVVLMRNQAARQRFDAALLDVPLVGRLVAERDTARFSRTLGTLLRSGVPLLDALRSAGGVLRNSAFKAAVREAAGDLKEGSSLIAPLARSGRFSELALRLIGVGERTGQLEAMLLRVAEIYEASVERQLARLTGLVGPVLTIVIGLAVGALILSVMGAIVGINDLAVK